MKIAANLGCKDELDLLGPCLAHLKAIGVDHVIASDSRSTDGSREALAARVGSHFDLYDFDDLNPDPAYEAAETARIVARAGEIGADWLIFVDADEFPLPATGDLRRVRALQHCDVVNVNRYNVPLLPQGPAISLPPVDPAEVPLFVPAMGRNASQSLIRKDPEAPWIRVIPAPKVMIRPAAVRNTAEGAHSVGKGDAGHREATAVDLVIAHVPFTTEERFARKVDNVRRAVAAVGGNWPPDSAWHWRRWLENVDQRGGVAGEMARNRITAAELDELRRTGVVRTAGEIFSG